MNQSVVKFCKSCVTPNTRPKMIFNTEDICSACVNQKKSDKTDWDKRRKEFLEIVQDIKSKKNNYDCVVPFSGGKDSATIALKLKFDFNLNPLLVTYAPVLPTTTGIMNRNAVINEGFTNIVVNTSGKVVKHLSKRFFVERGNPKKHWDAGIAAAPIKTAIEKKIPCVFFAEQPESEYGGRITKNESVKKFTLTQLLENWIGDDPLNWVDENVTEHDLETFCIPKDFTLKTIPLFFGYFFPWDVFKNYKYVSEKIKFTVGKERTIGTFTNYDSLDDKIDDLYYYMQFIKFGFGRCNRDASRHIMKEHITREQAIKYCQKYDGEFPKKNLKEYLDYYQISLDKFYEIVNKHRNPEIWKAKGNDFELINKLK